MSGEDEAFATAVLACIEDVSTLLPDLAALYPDRVITVALAEHVGGALRLCLRNGSCTPAQARRLISRMNEAAFGGAAR